MKKYKFTIMRIFFVSIIFSIPIMLYIFNYGFHEYYIQMNNVDKSKFTISVIGAVITIATFIISIINSWQQNIESMTLQFEDKFFLLIDIQRKIREEIDHSSEKHYRDKTAEGRKVFHYLFNEVEYKIDEYKDKKGFKSIISEKTYTEIANLYNEINDHRLMEHYFRHLYTIVVYVDDKNFLSDKQKHEYINMLRSQLSEYEIVYLYINTIATHNRYGTIEENNNLDACLEKCSKKECFTCQDKKMCKRFKIYIEKYALLDALPSLSDYIKPEQRAFFYRSAYENKAA